MNLVKCFGLTVVAVFPVVQPWSDIHEFDAFDANTADSEWGRTTGIVMAPPAPSSKCWQSAVTFLKDTNHDISTANSREELCKRMNHIQQKALALEIASCQMDDIGRDLFRKGGVCHSQFRRQCTDKHHKKDGLSLFECLKELSEDGVRSYTYYVSHVQIICVRLTQEVLLHHYQETQENILKQQFQSSQNAVEHWKRFETWAIRHEEQLYELSSTVPDQLVHVLSQHVADWSESQLVELMEAMQQEMSLTLNQVVKDHILEHEQALQKLQHDLQQQQSEWQSTMNRQVLKQQQVWNANTAHYQEQMDWHMQQHAKQANALEGQLTHLLDAVKAWDSLISMFVSSVLWIWKNAIMKSGPWIWLATRTFWFNLIPWMMLTRRSARVTRSTILWMSLLGFVLDCVFLGLGHFDKTPMVVNYEWLRQIRKLASNSDSINVFQWTWFCQGAAFLLSFIKWLIFGSPQKQSEAEEYDSHGSRFDGHGSHNDSSRTFPYHHQHEQYNDSSFDSAESYIHSPSPECYWKSLQPPRPGNRSEGDLNCYGSPRTHRRTASETQTYFASNSVLEGGDDCSPQTISSQTPRRSTNNFRHPTQVKRPLPMHGMAVSANTAASMFPRGNLHGVVPPPAPHSILNRSEATHDNRDNLLQQNTMPRRAAMMLSDSQEEKPVSLGCKRSHSTMHENDDDEDENENEPTPKRHCNSDSEEEDDEGEDSGLVQMDSNSKE